MVEILVLRVGGRTNRLDGEKEQKDAYTECEHSGGQDGAENTDHHECDVEAFAASWLSSGGMIGGEDSHGARHHKKEAAPDAGADGTEKVCFWMTQPQACQ